MSTFQSKAASTALLFFFPFLFKHMKMTLKENYILQCHCFSVGNSTLGKLLCLSSVIKLTFSIPTVLS